MLETKTEFVGVTVENGKTFADVEVLIGHSYGGSVGALRMTLSVPLYDPQARLPDLRKQALDAAQKLLNVRAAEDLLRSEVAKDPRSDSSGLGFRL